MTASSMAAPLDPAELWRGWEARGERDRAVSMTRADLLDLLDEMQAQGAPRMAALEAVAARGGVSTASLRRWRNLVATVPRDLWPAVLLPCRRGGRPPEITTDPAAVAFIKSDYLRASQPSWSSCYQRLMQVAETRGWIVGLPRTLKRQVLDSLPHEVVVAARKGEAELKTMFPPQRRKRAHLGAMGAVNLDGHLWDVMVEWEDGTRSRPMMTAAQDVGSGKMLAWRLAPQEDALTVRLMLADMFKNHGLPEKIYMDNGRAFAAKSISGGSVNRFRFKFKPEDPVGILKLLNIEAHFTKPYSGQSKPIERAFRDLADHVAKHPAAEGAYLGNTPANRPDKAGRAVPIAEFRKLVDQGMTLHNARPGRQTEACRGVLSFDDAFAELARDMPVRRATAAQLRLALLASQPVRASRQSGLIELMGNRYWSGWMNQVAGQKVVVRFDPEDLKQNIYLYNLEGKFLGTAELFADAGFDDMAAAKAHEKKRRQKTKLTRELLDLERRLSPREVAAAIPDVELPKPDSWPVVRMTPLNLPEDDDGDISARDLAAGLEKMGGQ
ncbi:MAG: Mu transposase C-terminal domain-containing protein [Alphaproteobacteria bacterium]|nr:Mu transposase C-terminal domain-containing protein [Alphaproteobacteria bacterium]